MPRIIYPVNDLLTKERVFPVRSGWVYWLSMFFRHVGANSTGLIMLRFYFSPMGRVTRRDMWMKFLLPCGSLATLTTLANVAGAATGMLMILPITTMVASLTGLVMFWPSIAVPVKRFHDRNMSGWWVLIFFVLGMVMTLIMLAGMAAGPMVTLVGSVGLGVVLLWQFVILFVLPGTSGDNRFGPDPKNPVAVSGKGKMAPRAQTAFDRRADAAIANAKVAMQTRKPAPDRLHERKQKIIGRKPDAPAARRPYVQGAKPPAFGRRKQPV